MDTDIDRAATSHADRKRRRRLYLVPRGAGCDVAVTQRRRGGAFAAGAALLLSIVLPSAFASLNAAPAGAASLTAPGDFYVTNLNAATVTEYAAGSNDDASPIATIAGASTELDQPSAVTVDGDGDVYVANFYAQLSGPTYAPAIVEFGPGSNGDASPIATISGNSADLSDPSGLALNSSHDLLVTNTTGNSVTEYASNASGDVNPIAVITGSSTGLDYPDAIAISGTGDIYVANALGNSVTEYAPGSNGNVSPIATISGSASQVSYPTGLAIGAAGTLYVSSDGEQAVTEYPLGTNGDVAPTAVVDGGSTGLSEPMQIALDGSGDLFAVNLGGSYSVTEYPPDSSGNVSPIATISGEATQLSNPVGIGVIPELPSAPSGAVATAGDTQATVSWAPPSSDGGAVVTSYTVTSYPSGFSTTVNGLTNSVVLTGLGDGTTYTFSVTATNEVGTGPPSVSSNPVTPEPGGPGAFYVTNAASNSVTEYSPGAQGDASPISTLSGSSTGLDSPNGIAVSAGGDLYVANEDSNSVTEYAHDSDGNASPISTLSGSTTGLDSPVGIALSAGGDLYVANESAGTVTEYAPGASGDAAPIATIGGPDTLDLPVGVALDEEGNLYVSCFLGPLNVYPPGTNGDVTPAESISGSSTGLSAPIALTVNDDGDLYVSNTGNSTITEYAPGANGDASPITTWSRSTAELNEPTGIALAPSGDLVVGNYANGGNVNEYAPGSNGAPVDTISGSATGLDEPTGLAVVPGPPTTASDVVATAGNGQATVSWLPPSNDGGSLVTSYTVTSYPSGFTTTVSGGDTSATVTGLTNGTAYSFTVTATNEAGSGSPSIDSNSVTPSSPESTTTKVSVKPKSVTQGASVTFSATVSASSGTPNGTVTFAVGSTTLCEANLSASKKKEKASCKATTAPTGTDEVTGTYSGSPGFATSQGQATLDVKA